MFRPSMRLLQSWDILQKISVLCHRQVCRTFIGNRSSWDSQIRLDSGFECGHRMTTCGSPQWWEELWFQRWRQQKCSLRYAQRQETMQQIKTRNEVVSLLSSAKAWTTRSITTTRRNASLLISYADRYDENDKGFLQLKVWMERRQFWVYQKVRLAIWELDARRLMSVSIYLLYCDLTGGGRDEKEIC